jgi:hypothetical protein
VSERRLFTGALIAFCVLSLLLPAACDAATVSFILGRSFRHPNRLHVAASSGEENRLIIRFERSLTVPGHWMVRDANAVLSARESCTALDEHTVRCGPETSNGQEPPSPLYVAQIELGDGGDEFSLTGSPEGVVVDGGRETTGSTRAHPVLTTPACVSTAA